MIELKLNLDEIGRARLKEAMAELELAEKFLNDGLVRNAAGKAFQAWKSYLSYLAIRNRDLFNFVGYKRVNHNIRVLRNDWVLAVMPTDMLMEIVSKLVGRVANVVELISTALVIQEYQYNGLDKTGIVSKIPSDESARQVISSFITRVREVLLRSEGLQ